jgi:hypothetical protein
LLLFHILSVISSFSTGKRKKYGYYRCFSKDCGQIEIRKEKLESSFLELLRSLRVSPDTSTSFRNCVFEVHQERQGTLRAEIEAIHSEIEALETKITSLHGVFVYERTLPRDLYEAMLADLKIRIAELQIRKHGILGRSLNLKELVDPALRIMARLDEIWDRADLEKRILLQQTVFPRGVHFSSETGFGTPLDSLPIGIFGLFSGPESKMATPTGFEPVSPA